MTQYLNKHVAVFFNHRDDDDSLTGILTDVDAIGVYISSEDGLYLSMVPWTAIQRIDLTDDS